MHDDSAGAKTQFQALYRVFLLRVVDLELLSADADTTRMLGQFAAIFAAVSFALTAPLIIVGGLPKEALWTVEHFLFALTMVVVGLFAVLSWESIFPTRLDLFVLGPLPVRPRLILSAKLAALTAALAISAVALNVFTGLIWPLLFSPPHSGFLGAVRSLGAYWLTVIAASTFIFCCVLSLHGLASQLLPRQQFLRLSIWIQLAALCLLLGAFILEPSLESSAALSAPGNQALLRALPSYWFLGLFQSLNGSMEPVFVPLLRHAYAGLSLAILMSMITLLLAYSRSLNRIVEEPDIVPALRSSGWLRSRKRSVQLPLVLFSIRTVLRSRQHRVLAALFLGLEFAIALVCMQGSPGEHGVLPGSVDGHMPVSFVIAGLLIMIFTILGTRFLFTVPMTLRANWIFRITEFYSPAVYLTMVRRSFYAIAVTPVWLLLSCFTLARCPSWAALAASAVLALVGIIMTDLCLWGFRKLPFACSYSPGNGNLHVVVWGTLFLLIPLIEQAAMAEGTSLQSYAGSALMLSSLGVCAFAVRRQTNRRAHANSKGLLFEDIREEELTSLQLAATPTSSSQRADR